MRTRQARRVTGREVCHALQTIAVCAMLTSWGNSSMVGPRWQPRLHANTAIMTYAQQFGAKVVQLEHRFYGMTNPFADLTVESLRFLSSEQVRA